MTTIRTKHRTSFLLFLCALAALALAALAAEAHAAGKDDPAAAERAAPAASGVVNLNQASEDELMQLPGVGPSKAAAIVAWRKKHGAFKRVDDLTRVKGFGRKTLTKLKPYLAVSGATTYRGKKSEASGDRFFGPPPAMQAP